MRLPSVLLGLVLSWPALADPPLRVTTDSPEYCDHLAARLGLYSRGALDPVRRLAEEGLGLCHAGQVRAGIAKLRRALRGVQVQGG